MCLSSPIAWLLPAEEPSRALLFWLDQGDDYDGNNDVVVLGATVVISDLGWDLNVITVLNPAR